jgi:hypothetical protein
MAVTRHLGVGMLPDVAFHGGQVWCGYQNGLALMLVTVNQDTLEDVSFTSINLGPEAGAFARLLSWEGRLWLVYRAGGPRYEIVLREVGGSHQEIVGVGHGNDMVALGLGDLAWQSSGAPDWQVARKSLSGAVAARIVRKGAPTGLSRVLEGDRVTLVDEERLAVEGHTRPCWAGDLVVAEGRETGAFCRLEDGRVLELWPGQEAFTPRCATDGQGRYVVATWGREGVRLARVSAVEFKVPSAIPQPERLPEGTEIDLFPYLVGDASTWPRHGDHYMHQVWDGQRNLHFLKFGPVAEGSTIGDAWERLVLDGDQFYLREDRSQSGAGIYSFHPGTAYARRMTVGQWIDVPDNVLQRYEKGTCRVIDQHPLPYRIGLVEAWKHFDCGGDLGIRDVIKCSYDPGGQHDTIEHFWYAKGAGWFRWQEQRQDDPSRTHTTSFNRIGGQALTPTQGCWRRDLVPWPPKPDPDPEPEPKPDPLPRPNVMRQRLSLKSAINDLTVCTDRGIPAPIGNPDYHGFEVRANRPGEVFESPGLYENHEVEFRADGNISIRSQISDNPAITALWSADDEQPDETKSLLVANRPDQPSNHAGPAECWKPVFVPEATRFNGTEVIQNAWALQNAHNGLFMTIDPRDPTGRIYARGKHPNENELFYSSVSLLGGGGGHVGGGPIGPSIITGRLRKEGRALADDAGYALPVFCHSGTGIADLLYDEATERHNAQLIKSVGFAGRRVWTRLRGTAPWSTNPQGWGGREFGHETMGDDAYRNLLITSFRQHQELGLKLALSAGDIEGIDNEHEIRKYVRLLGDALEAVSPDGSLCAIFESGNELPGIWRNGSPERARDWILKPFKARFPGVLCTNSQGANESREERFRWCLDPADLDDVHSFRDNHWYDWIRHVINNAYVHEHGTQPRELIWGSEPFGTGRLVSVQPNIHEYDEHVAQISVIAHLMTGQIPCYFCSPGIRFDVARDRYGETYEAMPGFATCASVAKLLPADIMTWPRENIVHGGREDPPGSPNPIFEEPGAGEIDRAYHVFSADHSQFAALIFGGESLDSRAYRAHRAEVDHRFGNKARLVVGRA